MLTWLSDWSHLPGVFRLFHWLTFRALGAAGTALFLVLFFGPTIISRLRLKQGKGQPIRTDGPASHLLTKKGTPTMGGLMILFGLFASSLLWADPESPYVWIVLFVTFGFGAIGFYDDYLKVTQAVASRFLRPRAARRRVRDRGDRLLCDDGRGRRRSELARRAVRQRIPVRFRLGLSAVRPVRDRRLRQRGQPDRRPRRPRDRAGDDRGRDARAHLLPRRQRLLRPLPPDPPRAAAPATSWSFAAR